MKRIIGILGGYLGFCFIICVVIGLCRPVNVDLLGNSAFLYKFYKGLVYFFNILPSIAISGFFAACSISFGRHSEGSVSRFSQAMLKRYKYVIITSLVLTALITFSIEIFDVGVKKGMEKLESRPKLVTEYVVVSENYLAQRNPQAARAYADEALKLDPGNKRAHYVQNEADILLGQEAAGNSKFIKDADLDNVLFVEEDEDLDKERLHSAYAYLLKAKEYFNNQQWFNAHYYAEEGLLIASGKDANIAELKNLSALAWNNLTELHSIEKENQMSVFEQKYKGYKALVEEDYLKAYYIFMNLQTQSLELSKDTDVLFYTDVALKKISEKTFFMDETFELKRFENATDIYFVLDYGDNGRDVVYFRGVTTTKESGNMVQYLRGLSIMSFDGNNKWTHTLSVPYAKVLAVSVKDMNVNTKDSLGIARDIDVVPYLMMKSVDRYTEGRLQEPQYTFAPGHNISEIKNRDFFLLPISFKDFQMLEEAKINPNTMDLMKLTRMIDDAETYGYSSEIYGQVLMNRIFYPFFLLIFLIVIAVFGWNNRIGQNTYFKTSWIFVFPVCAAITYIIEGLMEFVYRQINLIILSRFQSLTVAVIVGGILSVIGIVAASIMFLSRRASGDY